MWKKRDRSERLRGFARDLRKEATDAEKRMWLILRDRRFSGFKFRRQYPVGGYIIDFFCARCRLGIELDGGQHNEDANREYDQRRTEKLELLGICILRFWDHEVLKETDAVSETIYQALMERERFLAAPSPQPSPPNTGERG